MRYSAIVITFEQLFFIFLVENIESLSKWRDVDDVHNMMDEIAEQQDVAKEISDAISNPVGFGMFLHENDSYRMTFSLIEFLFISRIIAGQDIDEDELERELEELEQEELDKDLLGVGPSTQDLPEVPTAEPAKEPASSSKEKKRGKHSNNYTDIKFQSLCVIYNFCDLVNLISVPAKAADDDDLKMLESWAN